MTSLAKQLNKLAQSAGASTHGVKVVSLLFNQREAASMDMDDIFDLGLNGLLELTQMDERFEAFKKPLVSSQARRIDRGGISKEENEKLDVVIGKCLAALSPYFMLRPCHKVLEWLLRRFSVHQFNVDDVVACLLPYHETAVAARLVQLLHIDNTMFSFFLGVKKTGAPMPRHVLIERCVHSTNFLPFVSDKVEESSREGISNRPLYSLWGSLLVGVLRYRTSEETVRQVLSIALHAVRSADVHVRSGGLMALAQICASTALEQEALDLIVTAFLAAGELSALVLTFQTQERARFPSAASVKHVMATPLAHLTETAQKHDCTLLVRGLLSTIVSVSAEDQSETAALVNAWKAIAAHVLPHLSKEPLVEFTRLTMVHFARAETPPAPVLVQGCLKEVLHSLGPLAGEGVALAMQQEDDSEMVYRLENLAVDIFGPTSSHSPLPGSGTTLLLSLSHNDPRVRQLGLTAIDKEVRSNRLDVSHTLVTTATSLVADSDLQIAEFVLSCAWLPLAVGSLEALWRMLESCLNEAKLVRPALQVAFASKLPQAVPAAVRLCIQAPSVPGNPMRVNHGVIAACQQEVDTHKKKAHALVTAIASCGSAKEVKPPSSKKQKAGTTPPLQAAGLQGLIASLARACGAHFAETWEPLRSHLNKHACLLVCMQVLTSLAGDAKFLTAVSDKAAELLLDSHLQVPVAVTSDDDDESAATSLWNPMWESSLEQAVSDGVVALVRHGSSSLEADRVFQVMASTVSGDIGPIASLLLPQVDAPVSFLWRQATLQDDLISIHALHLLEAAYQSAPDSAVASHLPSWLGSLCVPLQSSNSRVRRAACRVVARLCKLKKLGKSFPAVILRAINENQEVKASDEAFAIAVGQVSGKAPLKWAAEVLADERADATVVAILRAVRLSHDASRLELFQERLRAALDQDREQEVQLLLEGLGGCAKHVAKHEETIQILCEALQKPEPIALAALRVISPQLWETLDATGKRLILSGLCVAAASGIESVSTAAANVTREVGAARGTDIVAAELHLNLGSTSGSGRKKTRQAAPNRTKLLAELSRVEVVLELLKASRGGDAVTATALMSLLGELNMVASIDGGACDYTMQLAVGCLAPLVEGGLAHLTAKEVDTLLACLYSPHPTPALRNSIMHVLCESADADPLPIARQVAQLFRANDSLSITVDNKLSFRIMQSLLEKVLPHLSEEHADNVLDEFAAALPSVPAHRRLVLMQSAAQFLPGNPLGRILVRLLPIDAALAVALCEEVGPVQTASGLVDFLQQSGNAAFVGEMLSSTGFISGCVALESRQEQTSVQDSLGALFQQLIVRLESGSKQNLAPVYDAIDAVNELFTIPAFLVVIRDLLQHSDSELRLRSMAVLNERVTSHREVGLTPVEEEAFVALMPFLEAMLQQPKKMEDNLLQAILLSLDILGRNFGSSHSQATLSVLKTVLHFLEARGKSKRTLNTDLYGSGLLTVSALCSKLGPAVLPVLTPCVQLLLSVPIASTKTRLEVRFAAASAVLELTVSLGSFLGPHARQMLLHVLEQLPAEEVLLKRVDQLMAALAQTLEARLLAPVLRDLIALPNLSQKALDLLLDCAAAASSHSSRPADLTLLWSVPMAALANESVLLANADAAAEIAFHLSETQFRPLFRTLVEQASNDAALVQGALAVGAALLRKLKALAVSWCSQLAPLAAQEMSPIGVEFVRVLCVYDTELVLGKEVHSELTEPLVKALAHQDDGVRQAIVELCVSMNSDALWRPLNSALVMRLREADAAVRVAVLKTMCDLWNKFEEDFLVLLPDVMPALGEVMEDDDDGVVQESQRLLAIINALLPNKISF